MSLNRVTAALSRSLFGHNHPWASCMQTIQTFNYYQNKSLFPCLIGDSGMQSFQPLTMMDYLSAGTFYSRSYMKNWNRHLKKHGLRAKVSNRIKWAGNRVTMLMKVRRRTRYPRGVQIPKKRHKSP